MGYEASRSSAPRAKPPRHASPSIERRPQPCAPPPSPTPPSPLSARQLSCAASREASDRLSGGSRTWGRRCECLPSAHRTGSRDGPCRRPKDTAREGGGEARLDPPPPPSTRRWGCTSTERSARRLPLRPTPRAVPPHGVRSQQVVSPARQAAAPRVAVNRAAPSTMRAAPLSHPPLPPLRAPAELRGEPRGFGPSLGRIEDVGGVVRVTAKRSPDWLTRWPIPLP